MGRRSVLEVGVALVAGVAIGTVAHVWHGPAGAASPLPQVAGAVLERGELTGDQLEASASSVVVRVRSASCGGRRQGSATFVAGARGRPMLLTNAHVARGAASVTADLPDGTTVVVDVVGAIVGRDAALLDAAPLVEAGLVPAARGPGVGDGDRVVVVGHPGGTFRVDGTVVAQVQRRAAYGGASDVLITASAAQGGQSGGALLDRGGAVVGLVAARDPVTGSVVAYRIGDLVDEPVGAPPPC